MKLKVVQHDPTEGTCLIAELEDYDGPVPRVGEYLIHPVWGEDGLSEPEPFPGHNVTGQVKAVHYQIYARPPKGVYVSHFVKRFTPYVEVHI